MYSKSKLFDEKADRCTTFPIAEQGVWDFYKKMLKAHWTVEGIDTSKDYLDFIKLSAEEQYFVKMILGFFSFQDGIVTQNICERFIQELKMLEVKYAYQFQASMENIHAEMYSIMIDSLIPDRVEKNRIFNVVNTMPCMQKKAMWSCSWITSDSSFAKRLIAFAIVEGVFFSGAFCAIYWLKQRNILAGLTQSNEYIARDEGMHTDFAVYLYNTYFPSDERLDFEEVKQMMIEAVEIEDEFINVSLPCKLIGMNSDKMKEYIRFVADRLMRALGYDKVFYATNPFLFMENISLEVKTNFFENRNTSYQKSNISDLSFENSNDF